MPVVLKVIRNSLNLYKTNCSDLLKLLPLTHHRPLPYLTFKFNYIFIKAQLLNEMKYFYTTLKLDYDFHAHNQSSVWIMAGKLGLCLVSQ